MGQPPFVCRASGEGLQDGRTYYRADGETREPTSSEWDQLMARGARQSAAPVELNVAVVGHVVAIAVDEKRTLEEFIEKTRTRLIKALPAADARQTPSTSRADTMGFAGDMAMMLDQLSTSSLMATQPEKRTEADYLSQIDSWEADFRNAWPHAVDLFVSYSLPPNEISVTNETRTYLHDVEVRLHLEGLVTTLEPEYATEEGPGWRDLKLPSPPRKWGPTKRDMTSGLGIQRDWGSLVIPSNFPPRSFPPSRTAWTNGGSVDVAVGVGDLRPEAAFESDDQESILVIRGGISATLHGTWSATARGYNDVFRGEIEVEVSEPMVLTDLLRAFLEL